MERAEDARAASHLGDSGPGRNGGLAVTLRSGEAWILLLYLAFFASLPHGGFWINDNGAKFIQLQAIERNGFAGSWVADPGEAIDPTRLANPLPAPFGQVVDGRLHVAYSPVFTYVSALPHLAFGDWGLRLLPLLGGLATLWGVRRLALVLEDRPSPSLFRAPAAALAAGTAASHWALCLAALATPVLFYSFTFWEHTPALAFGVWALVAWLRYRDAPTTHNLLATVACLCGAIYLRTDAYLFAFVLGGVSLVEQPARWRRHAVGLGVLFVGLLPLWSFHVWTTGQPLGLHVQAQGWSQLGLASLLAERLEVANNVLANLHASPLLSWLGAAPFVMALVAGNRIAGHRFTWALLAWGACLGGAIALAGQLRSDRAMPWLLQSNGLFAASPILALGLLTNDTEPRRERALRRVLLGNVLLYVTLVPAINSSGIHWGCRFLLVAYPLLAALAGVELARSRFEHTRGRVVRAAVAALLVLSIALQLYSLQLLRARLQFSEQLAATVAALPRSAVVTSIAFVPQDLARIFFQRPVFLVDNREQLALLLAALRNAGVTRASVIRPAPEPRESGTDAVTLDDGWLGLADLTLRTLPIEAAGHELPRTPGH